MSYELIKDKQDIISILLIEDLVGDAKAITRAISNNEFDHDFQITTASRLKHGIEILKKSKINVILLDLSLPDAKDIKAVTELNNLFPQIPIIVLSDQSDENLISRALSNGATKFLTKNEATGILIRKVIDQVIIEQNEELLV